MTRHVEVSMRWIVLLGLCLVACGSSNPWGAMYAGQVQFTNSCVTQSPNAPAPEVVLTLSESGSTVTASGLGCDFTASVSGSQATLSNYQHCDPNAQGMTLGYNGGQLTSEGNTLILFVSTYDERPDGSTCTGSINAPLTLVSGSAPASTWNPYQGQ
jgi:hypothetical protein